MKLWLRLTLITMTVGGGFAGSVFTFRDLQSGITSHTQPALNLLIIGFFLLLNAGIVASGLLFVCKPDHTNPLLAALAIQVPSISSFLIAYQFATGFELVVSIKGPAKGEDLALHAGCAFFLGSRWTLSFLQEQQFGIGVNVWALFMLVLLLRSMRTPTATAEKVISSPEQNSVASP